MNTYVKIGIGVAVGLGAAYAISKIMPKTIYGARKTGAMITLAAVGGYVAYKMKKK